MYGPIPNRFRYRATGLIRTFVVGSATLAILLVCFAMYQYTQVEATAPVEPKRPRLPSLSATGQPITRSGSGDTTGVPIQGAAIGPGRGVKLTIYSPEGTRARFDIEVQDWTPRPGAMDEFVLVRPRIRMRTKSGNAVRVTADEGVIEAQRRGGGSLDPRRGRLTGHVVIEYDRLTDRQRAARAAENTDEIDPSELVRVEMSEIEFDLEYAKVTVPGRLTLLASDVELTANDVEARFNETENRVETLRIAHGGRITLRGNGAVDSPAMPGVDSAPSRRYSISQWLRETLTARLTTGAVATEGTRARTTGAAIPGRSDSDQPETARAARTTPKDSRSEPAVTRRADGAYVFRDGQGRDKPVDAPVRFFARFERNLDVTRSHGHEVVSRLQADWLEILRDVTRQDTAPPPTRERNARTDGSAADAPPPADRSADQIVVAWTGRLGVEAVDREGPDDDPRTRVSAGGAPVRVSHRDGDATCIEFTYYPSDTEIELRGTTDHPVHVRSSQHGSLVGTALVTRRDGDTFSMEVSGPGSLERTARTGGASYAAEKPSDANTPRRDPTRVADSADALRITFDDRLTATGRFVTERKLDFPSLTVSENEVQLLDEATLTGAVRLAQRDVRVDADALSVRFVGGDASGASPRAVDRLHGVGHVSMTQGDDRLQCDELELFMAADDPRGTRPRQATARGDVVAIRGDRLIKAREELVILFGVHDAGTLASDGTEGSDGAVAGRDESRSAARVLARHLRANGDVVVMDPAQRLDVHAETLDCAFTESGTIDAATVTGLIDRPASVRLDDFSVVGRTITFDVGDESAEVPGAGRLTLQSMKDLDGRRLDAPIPIAVTWTRSLRYTGSENRAVFRGDVHATSRTSTTFDCDRLLVEFDEVTGGSHRDVRPTTGPGSWLARSLPAPSWSPLVAGVPETVLAWYHPDWLTAVAVSELITQNATSVTAPSDRGQPFAVVTRSHKEPAYLLATGGAVALVSDFDAQTGDLVTRARISGPKLSLNLRADVSKMLIEGPGNLLLEDYRDGTSSTGDASPPSSADASIPTWGARRGLLSNANVGPSNTLIEWQRSMWYDFSIEQTRFEGDVELKHFSGAALHHALNQAPGDGPAGRSTFLSCDMLAIDFLDRAARRRSAAAQRMGGLSSGALRQFDARGHVRLQDVTQRLNLQADQVVYERPRDILVIHGSPERKARIVRYEANKLPTKINARRMIYDLSTGKFSIDDPEVFGQ